jgi:predicted glycosyltransferase
LRDLYDDIWVYGLPQICNPLAGIDLPEAIKAKMTYTGYLRRKLPQTTGQSVTSVRSFDEPYLLVTTGGGGDGEQLIHRVLRAYEVDPGIPYPALLVFGPFMAPRRRERFCKRVERLSRVEAITFDTKVEQLMAGAAGIVAMGGYNTFCEILSLDKPALIVPRRRPRMEQYIRAHRAHELGLVTMLANHEARTPHLMAAALRRLPHQLRPSAVFVPGLLDGLDNIQRMVDAGMPVAFEPHVGLATQGV